MYPPLNSAVDRRQWPRKDYHADPRHIAIVAALRADICLTQETMTMDAHIEGMAVIPSHELFLACEFERFAQFNHMLGTAPTAGTLGTSSPSPHRRVSNNQDAMASNDPSTLNANAHGDFNETKLIV